MNESGTPQEPWVLSTPPQTSAFEAWFDNVDGVDVVVVRVGATVLHYDRRCIDDLVAMLTAAGDWVELGGADEQKEPKPNTVEAWGRSPQNSIGGWYGLKKGLRGRFAVYVPPVLERLGLIELEHQPRNNRARALT